MINLKPIFMKSIIFKILAVVVAFSGAYASVRANSALLQTPYVQYTTNNTSDPSCTVAIGQCEEVGTSEQCTVRVIVGSTVISSSYWGKQGPGSGACGSLLTNTNSAVAATKTFPAGTTVVLQ